MKPSDDPDDHVEADSQGALNRPAEDSLERRSVFSNVHEALFGRPLDPVSLGRFVLREPLGSGSTGTVYAAWDPTLEREVALKVLDADFLAEDRSVRAARHLREARALSRLAHPHIVAVYDAGEQDDRVFIAMERVRGVTLREFLEEQPRETTTTLRLLCAAGSALQCAHDAGMVHRDFKPENVLIDDSLEAHVVDFGLVRAEARADEWPSSVTETGALVGTPAYASPEQLRGDPATARSDQYSFCVVLYEALFGRLPYGGGSPAECFAAKLSEPPVVPTDTPDVPGPVRRAVLRGLNRDPERRHASMEQLLERLEASLDDVGATGRRLDGRYRLENVLGTGGMGIVYRALDESTGRAVAVKIMRGERSADARARERMEREVQAAAALDHPGIVPVLESGVTDEGEAFLVMEIVRGRSLREILETDRFEPEAVIRIVTELADALETAHRAGLVHRDVKPDNAMLREDGTCVLLDFGIVKHVDGDLETLTADDQLLGTTAYLSPEQVRGRSLDGRSDQFSLAVTAHELLTGQLPWHGSNTAILAQIVSDDPAQLSNRNSELAPLDQAIRRALQKQPEDRFGSTTDFADALARAWSTRGSVPRRRGRGLMAAGLVGAGIASAALWWPRDPDRPREPRSTAIDAAASRAFEARSVASEDPATPSPGATSSSSATVAREPKASPLPRRSATPNQVTSSARTLPAPNPKSKMDGGSTTPRELPDPERRALDSRF